MFAPSTGQQTALVAKGFKQLNFPGTFITTAQNANDSFAQLAGDAASIVNISAPKILVYKDLPASDPDKPRLAAFAEKYTAKTGKAPTQNAAVGYDMMFSITEALKTAGTDSVKLQDALEAQSGVQLLTGQVRRSASQHNGMISNWAIVGIDDARQFRLKE